MGILTQKVYQFWMLAHEDLMQRKYIFENITKASYQRGVDS